MNDLLHEVLTAHGGADRWKSVSTVAVTGHIGGLLPKRFAGNKLADFSFEIRTVGQHTVIHGFPGPGKRVVFDRGDVRIESEDAAPPETRTGARAAFFGLSGIRRNFHWDPLDVGYFAGYASWNYLTSPWLLARDGVEVRENGTWHEGDETWRRLDATFPPGFHTHCRQQTFYVDADGLIRRHDFVAEPVGRWAGAALYCDQHREIDGLLVPTRRRVLPRGPRRKALPHPVLLDLRFDDIEIGWDAE